jgi:methylmalonyl-CoA mutase C-terminal domain/subunit
MRKLDQADQQDLTNRTVNAHAPKRILIGKVGLDGHDRGAKFLIRALRDAGYEVIYTGIRRTPEQIVRTAIDEDVDVIGLSLLSGAHNELFARVAELLKEEGVEDVVLLAGGTIPEKDIPHLAALGFRHVFTPGAPMSEILRALRQELSSRE